MNNRAQNTPHYIQDYDGPCPYCGFHLHHPKSNACSECGNILEITLKTPFVLTGWLLGFVGLSSSIVIFTVHLVFQLAGAYMNGGYPNGNMVVSEAIIIVGLVFVSFLWVILYRWFSYRKKNTKVIVGTLGCLLPFGMYQILIWVIFR